MKFSRLLGALALLMLAGSPVLAADMVFHGTGSNGNHFLAGPRQFDGSDLNTMVDVINSTASGTINSNALIGSGVNKVSIAGGATTVDPVLTVGGASSDTNIGLLITGKGSGPVHLGGTTKNNGSVRIPTVTNAVNAIDLEGAATLGIPFITVGGLVSDTNDSIAIYGKGTGSVLVGDGTTTLAGLQVAKTTSAVNDIILTPGATGSRPSLVTGGAGVDTNIGMAIAGAGTGSILIGGTTATLAGLQVAQTASRVNDIIVTPSATAGIPTITAGGAGADANSALALAGNGTGNVLIGGATTTLAGLQVAQTATAVNDLLVTNGVTGTPVALNPATAGADTNIGMVLLAKGTGAIGLGGTTLASASVQVATAASQVDYVNFAGGTTANPATVTQSAAGTDTNVNIAVTPKGSGVVKVGGTIATCSGTTTATCQGQRFVASVTGLSTAASTAAAAMTVTNASVVSSASNVICQDNTYGGTGVPVITKVTPGTGSVSFVIQNVSTGAALNATVPVFCFVFGS